MKRAAELPCNHDFFAAFSARFSFKVFSGFFLVSFFWFMPFAMMHSPWVVIELSRAGTYDSDCHVEIKLQTGLWVQVKFNTSRPCQNSKS
jgi:hypothetical protein